MIYIWSVDEEEGCCECAAPKILLPKSIFCDIMFLLKEIDTEFSVYFKFNKKKVSCDKVVYEITEMFIPEQLVTKTSVTYTDIGLLEIQEYRGKLHSHSYMNADFSRIDEEFSNKNNDLVVVVNKFLEFKAKARCMHNNMKEATVSIIGLIKDLNKIHKAKFL